MWTKCGHVNGVCNYNSRFHWLSAIKNEIFFSCFCILCTIRMATRHLTAIGNHHANLDSFTISVLLYEFRYAYDVEAKHRRWRWWWNSIHATATIAAYEQIHGFWLVVWWIHRCVINTIFWITIKKTVKSTTFFLLFPCLSNERNCWFCFKPSGGFVLSLKQCTYLFFLFVVFPLWQC